MEPQDSSKESWHASAAHAAQASWENALGTAFGANTRNQIKPYVEKNLSDPTPGERTT